MLEPNFRLQRSLLPNTAPKYADLCLHGLSPRHRVGSLYLGLILRVSPHKEHCKALKQVAVDMIASMSVPMGGKSFHVVLIQFVCNQKYEMIYLVIKSSYKKYLSEQKNRYRPVYQPEEFHFLSLF